MSGAGLPRPRDWIGPGTYPWPPVRSLSGGATVVACFAVAGFQLGRTRQEKNYLRLQLADRYGTVEGRVWDDAEQFVEWLRPGLYVGVRGQLEIFNGERQLRIDSLAQIRVTLDELELFIPRSERDPRVMDRELNELIASVRDKPFRALLERLLAEHGEIGRGFRLAPAAKQNHHAYLGGLLEHTISVTRLCDALARHYDGDLDRDLLIAAALLHDIGKVREIGAQAGFPYTDEGKLLGHILLGLQMVASAAAVVPDLDPDRLLLLQHLIASHQGRYEWQSPREPRILEGLLLHYADDLDAKVTQARRLFGDVAGGWTAYDRSFGRDFLRHLNAADGVADVPPPAPAAPPRADAPAPVRPGHAGGPGEAADPRATQPAVRRPRNGSVPGGPHAADPSRSGSDSGPARSPESGTGAPGRRPEGGTLDLFRGSGEG